MGTITTRTGITYRDGVQISPVRVALPPEFATTKCSQCMYVGVPRGARNSACCDRSSENYHRQIGTIEACRRWKR